MWIGTGNGISRVQIVNGKYYIVNYTIKDGLICNDTNIHAILKLDNGNILIGTPQRISDNHSPRNFSNRLPRKHLPDRD